MDVGDGPTLTGATCSMRWRPVTSTLDVHPDATPTELFVYVARGAIVLEGNAGGKPLPAGTLIIVPPSKRHVQVTPDGPGASLIEFHVTRH